MSAAKAYKRKCAKKTCGKFFVVEPMHSGAKYCEPHRPSRPKAKIRETVIRVKEKMAQKQQPKPKQQTMLHRPIKTEQLQIMLMFRKDVPKPEEMMNWAAPELDEEDVDLVLEFLRDSNLLNKKGKKFAHAFWERYIHDADFFKNKSKQSKQNKQSNQTKNERGAP